MYQYRLGDSQCAVCVCVCVPGDLVAVSGEDGVKPWRIETLAESTDYARSIAAHTAALIIVASLSLIKPHWRHQEFIPILDYLLEKEIIVIAFFCCFKIEKNKIKFLVFVGKKKRVNEEIYRQQSFH